MSTVLADPRWFESEKEIFDRDDGRKGNKVGLDCCLLFVVCFVLMYWWSLLSQENHIVLFVVFFSLTCA